MENELYAYQHNTDQGITTATFTGIYDGTAIEVFKYYDEELLLAEIEKDFKEYVADRTMEPK